MFTNLAQFVAILPVSAVVGLFGLGCSGFEKRYYQKPEHILPCHSGLDIQSQMADTYLADGLVSLKLWRRDRRNLYKLVFKICTMAWMYTTFCLSTRQVRTVDFRSGLGGAALPSHRSS